LNPTTSKPAPAATLAFLVDVDHTLPENKDRLILEQVCEARNGYIRREDRWQ